ncbi:GHKL domain-containing protein [Lachnospiraceae bacterium]|nr:GHKL domain-containing protein [Lachnospiraceae bacterium]
MLGGSFWIALLRNAISTGLMLSFFFMLDRPRFSMKKTAWCYIIFGVSMVTAYSVWYLAANSSFVRFAALSALPVIGVFCSIMSSEVLHLSLYKMALAFYLFSVCTFCGVDVARWWFGGNLWIDILVRFVCFVLILIFTWFKFRKQFLGGVDFLLQEMDMFSATALFVSVMLGAIMAYWPNLQGFSVFNMVRAFLILFMAGTLQYAILHLYIHLGQEHYYQAEKELLEVNEQLLHQQMDLMRESKIEAARIRHDVRHHTLLIREYVQKREYSQLLAYLTQYDEDVEKWEVKDISRNLAVNSILLAYAKKARRQNIQVTMDIRLGENLPVRDIDWIAILANMFENAIHGCVGSGQPQQEIDIYISQKKNKVIIQCQNTSSKEVVFRKGLPQSDKGGGVGVTSIIKAVSRYEGATDFSVQDGMFITRILLNLT